MQNALRSLVFRSECAMPRGRHRRECEKDDDEHYAALAVFGHVGSDSPLSWCAVSPVCLVPRYAHGVDVTRPFDDGGGELRLTPPWGLAQRA